MVAFIAWLCWLTAAVILWILFFTTALDPDFLTCALALFVTGFVLRHGVDIRKKDVNVHL